MFDTKLIQGLLIAACVFLAIGVLTSALEIQKYKAGPTPSSSSPPRAESPEQEETDEEAPADTEVEADTGEEDGGDAE